MMILQMLLAAQALAAQPTLPVVDGMRLREGEVCYGIFSGDRRVGTTRQRVVPVTFSGAPAWQIVVHQRLSESSFEMRDVFLVDRATLRPMSLLSRRGADRQTPGWQQVAVDYRGDTIVGMRETGEGREPLAFEPARRVWDGNLWGLLFASLPLADNASFAVPMWQYDKGAGEFVVRVSGSETVQTRDGPVDAWIVEAGTDPERLARYEIAKKTRMELGYSAGPMRQSLEGTCV
ncbi:hypothetical protein WJS89_09975 [Sphingomicrobium sp. XHP0235]|uniref:DUF3108 domain-containing protein n=1 Tax=Sphingomicrobium aquimarinum TaxID=3133971 RepID=UPI0031FF2ACC